MNPRISSRCFHADVQIVPKGRMGIRGSTKSFERIGLGVVCARQLMSCRQWAHQLFVEVGRVSDVDINATVISFSILIEPSWLDPLPCASNLCSLLTSIRPYITDEFRLNIGNFGKADSRRGVTWPTWGSVNLVAVRGCGWRRWGRFYGHALCRNRWSEKSINDRFFVPANQYL